MFGFGLQYVPELKWLKFMTWHIREEMEHYEDVVKMYRELTGESVEPIVNERLRKRPIEFATSWYELAMAQFLYDRGGFWQLQEYERCSYPPYREVIGRSSTRSAATRGWARRSSSSCAGPAASRTSRSRSSGRERDVGPGFARRRPVAYSPNVSSESRFAKRCRRAAEERLRVALALSADGFAMKRLSLRRRHPRASRAEIERLLEAWLADRPPDAPGRIVPWPRPRRAR
jgi:hypothetical protein